MAKKSGWIESEGPIVLSLPVTASTAAGALVQIGSGPMYGYTQSAEGEDGNADGYASVMVPLLFAETLEVVAEDNAGGSAVAIGDELYKDSTEINKDSTNGTKAGLIALGAIASGVTADILVGFVCPRAS